MRKILASLFAVATLVSPAAARDILTIYTYDSFVSDWGPGPKVKAAFEDVCACTVEWVGLGDGVAMLNRLKLEGKDTKADVVLGLDTNLTSEAAATGLFAPHGLDPARAKTPVAWTDPLFMPYDYAHFAVVHDSETMPEPPKSLDELVNGDATQKIVLQDPRTSTPGLGFLLWMKSVYGERAPEAWKKLKPRILTTTPGWSEAYGLFTKGEAPMVFSYVTSPAYHMIEEKTERYKAAGFAEGHYLQIEVAGAVASSPEKDLALRFLDFMMSPAFQEIIPTANWMMPAAPGDGGLPDAFNSLVKPAQTFLFPPEEVAANRRVWIDEWLNAMAN